MAEKQNILVTFDIDNTLMIAGNGGMDHRNAMRYAIKTMSGIDKDPNTLLNRRFDGCSDMWICSESLKKALSLEEVSKDLIDEFYRLSGEYFIKNHKGNSVVYPGVVHLLEHLSSIPGVHLGLVTGNIPEIGWRKLELCGIDKYFDRNLGGLGTHMQRADIVRGVVDKATKLYGKLTRAVHIGDAMQDVEAAIEAGVIAIAVSTGIQENKIFKQPAFILDTTETSFDDIVSVILTGKTVDGADHVDQKFD